jgi:phage terminase small subunit
MPRKGGSGPRKQPGQAVDKRNGRKITLRPRKLTRFDLPEGLSERARAAWAAYWDDPVSELATPADRPLLLRWAKLMDLYDQLITRALAEPEIRGSTGQKQASPFFALAMQHETAISRIEAQLGIGPKNRASLGIAVLSEQKSLADLNAEFEDEGNDRGADLDGDEDEDPRVVAGSVEG